LGIPVILLTRGTDGCLVANSRGSRSRSVYATGANGDGIGTGDAFVGGYVAQLLRRDRPARELGLDDLGNAAEAAQRLAATAAGTLGAGWDLTS
jgi:sugar/nucleoside kinase (ribokinase family)